MYFSESETKRRSDHWIRGGENKVEMQRNKGNWGSIRGRKTGRLLEKHRINIRGQSAGEMTRCTLRRWCPSGEGQLFEHQKNWPRWVRKG